MTSALGILYTFRYLVYLSLQRAAKAQTRLGIYTVTPEHPCPEDIKLFPMLNSDENELHPAHKC